MDLAEKKIAHVTATMGSKAPQLEIELKLIAEMTTKLEQIRIEVEKNRKLVAEEEELLDKCTKKEAELRNDCETSVRQVTE